MRSSVSVLLSAFAATALVSGCGDSKAGSMREKPPPPVVIVSTPVDRPVVDYADFTGRVDSAETVDIRARVTGFLQKTLFEDGSELAKGAPLYEIDDREYRADLAAADAELAGAQAQFEKADTDFKRAKTLRDKGSVSAEEFDRADAAKKQADATVQAAWAKQDRARLNLDFTKIAAPISGKISRTQITEGNLVKADSTLLTTIVSVDPMYVYFDIDERTMLTIRQQIREGKIRARDDKEIPVLMGLAIEAGYPRTGFINFIENRVDPGTGSISLRGEFKNPRPDVGKRVLTPGLFARVRVPIGDAHRAVLVTERAIGADQGQKFVYVVDEKDEVVFRPVTLGAVHDGLRAIVEGLSSGERIIIDGLQRVRPGAVVAPKAGDMRARPGTVASGDTGESGAKAAETPETSTKQPAE